MSWKRTLGLVLAVVGAGLVLVPAGLLAYGNWRGAETTQQWEQTIRTIPPPVSASPTTAPAAVATSTPAALSAPPRARRSGPAVFALRISRLGYYSAVVEGVSLSQLNSAPGHYPGTALPGRSGVVGVAGHNSYWLRFGELNPGDRVVLEAADGTFTYEVTGKRILAPSDSTALRHTSMRNQLILTTCWPLWAGAFADRRLAIVADQLGGVA